MRGGRAMRDRCLTLSLKFKSKERGFTLVELMVVVAIIGALVNMAMPVFKVFKIKAARSEMRVNLNHAHSLVRSYMAETGQQPLFFHHGRRSANGNVICREQNNEALGFRIDCQNARYYYSFEPSHDYYDIPTSIGATLFTIRALSSSFKYAFGLEVQFGGG